MKDRTFASFLKDLTSSSVHVTTAIGNDGEKPKAKTFKEQLDSKVEKRALHEDDNGTAKTPFVYDVNALSSLRPDQVPRFFGALTEQDKLPTKEVRLEDLTAMQDRVDPAKVQAIREGGAPSKLPVVVQHNNKNYIADGHHRLAAQWLNGETSANVRVKDLTDYDTALKRATGTEVDNFRIAKVDNKLGLVFGWAIVCKVKGEDYYDLNVDAKGPHAGERVPEHIPEDVMTKAAADFMKSDRLGNEMHEGPDVGHFVFAFPMTTDIAKSMGIETDKTGLMVAYSAPPDVLRKFEDGTYTGFSIEGKRLEWTEHE